MSWDSITGDHLILTVSLNGFAIIELGSLSWNSSQNHFPPGWNITSMDPKSKDPVQASSSWYIIWWFVEYVWVWGGSYTQPDSQCQVKWEDWSWSGDWKVPIPPSAAQQVNKISEHFDEILLFFGESDPNSATTGWELSRDWCRTATTPKSGWNLPIFWKFSIIRFGICKNVLMLQFHSAENVIFSHDW